MLAISLAAVLLVCPPAGADGVTPQPVVPNDNRQAAGALRDGVLTLELRAQAGLWRPEGESRSRYADRAFGEGRAARRCPHRSSACRRAP